MPRQKSCPLKFGSAVSTEGILIEIPCCGDACAWWFDNQCAVAAAAKGLCNNRKRAGPKGTAAD